VIFALLRRVVARFSVLLVLIGFVAASSSAHAYDASVPLYDSAHHSVDAHTSEVVVVASKVATEGPQRTAATTQGPFSVLLRLSVAADSASLSGRMVTESGYGDIAIRNALRADPEAGMFDVIGHGTPSSVSGMSSSELAAQIRANSGWAGQDVRLLSCSTGCPSGGFAQGLANDLGVTVRAPSTDIYVSSRGGITFDPGGYWRTFTPSG
jgi:hypothetical protein